MLPKKRKFVPAEFDNFNFASSGQQEASNEDDHVATEDNNEAEMEDVGIDLSCKTRPSPDKEVVTAFRKISNDNSVSTAPPQGPSSSIVYEARWFFDEPTILEIITLKVNYKYTFKEKQGLVQNIISRFKQ